MVHRGGERWLPDVHGRLSYGVVEVFGVGAGATRRGGHLVSTAGQCVSTAGQVVSAVGQSVALSGDVVATCIGTRGSAGGSAIRSSVFCRLRLKDESELAALACFVQNIETTIASSSV